MSWSVSIASTAESELFLKLDEDFESKYPNPAPGVREQFEVAKKSVETLLECVKSFAPAELYYVVCHGHAKQGENDLGGNFIHVNVGGHY